MIFNEFPTAIGQSETFGLYLGKSYIKIGRFVFYCKKKVPT
jgi:hypothetical protein